MFTRSICVGFFALFVFSMMANGQVFDKDPWFTWDVNKGLSGGFSIGGYKFDSPIERRFVNAYRWVNSYGQVTDCPSRCRYYHSKNGNCFYSNSNDCSADCGCGAVCRCY